MKQPMMTFAAALVALVVAAPVAAQNCQTFYNPALPITGITGNDRHYKCYQRFVWFNQGKGSWCARDWYRSCMQGVVQLCWSGGDGLIRPPLQEIGQPEVHDEGLERQHGVGAPL